jgi:hypothetical protein
MHGGYRLPAMIHARKSILSVSRQIGKQELQLEFVTQKWVFYWLGFHQNLTKLLC